MTEIKMYRSDDAHVKHESKRVVEIYDIMYKLHTFTNNTDAIERLEYMGEYSHDVITLLTQYTLCMGESEYPIAKAMFEKFY